MGDDKEGAGEPVTAGGRGPWLRVTLASGADATLDAVYKAATRIGDLAPVTVRLRSSDSDPTTRVVVDGVEVGYLANAPGEWDDIAVRAQIGRLPSSPPYLMQVQLP